MTRQELEEGFARDLEKLARKHPCCELHVDWAGMISIIAHLQLSLRHPASKRQSSLWVRQFIDEFIASVESKYPSLALCLRAGDDPQMDVKRN